MAHRYDGSDVSTCMTFINDYISTATLTRIFMCVSGAARGSAKAVRECGAPPWRAVVCRVQTCPELAEENRRDLGAGSQQDQEHVLKFGKHGLKSPGGLWQSPAERRAAIDLIVLYQDLPKVHTSFSVCCHRIIASSLK